MQNLSLKAFHRPVFILNSLLILAGLVLLVGWVVIESNRFAELKNTLIAQMQRNALDVVMQAQQQTLAVANVMRESSRIGDAVAVSDYNKLLDTAQPMLQLPFINFLAIYRPDGVIALRAHDPAVFGRKDELSEWLTTSLAKGKPVDWTVARVGTKSYIFAGGRIENLNGLVGFVVAGTLLDQDFINQLQLATGTRASISYSTNSSNDTSQDERFFYSVTLPENLSGTPLQIFLVEPDKKIHEIWLSNLIWGIVWLVFGGMLILIIAVINSRQLTAAHDNVVRALDRADSTGRDLAQLLKREEEQRHHLDLIVRCAKVGSYEWQSANRTARFSPQLIEMLGYPPDCNTDDWKIEDFIHEEDRHEIMSQFFAAKESGQNIPNAFTHGSMDFRFQQANGATLWVHGNVEALLGGDGKMQKILASFIDINPLISAQENTRAALKRQEQLNVLRSKFVAMTSHEFRTPLAGILSSAELLKYYQDSLPADEKSEIISSIESSVARMTGMLDKVLLIGKAETGMLEFKPEPVNLRSMCDAILERSRSAGHGSGCSIKLVFDAKETIGMYDKNLLHHVFDNLLSNAVKYSPNGGEVCFRVRDEADQVVFSVSDEGIGIPADDLPDLFNSFQRASNVGDIPGTGLGLAIVKTSVELHGGTLHVESVAGKGATFTFRLGFLHPLGAEWQFPNHKLSDS